MDKNAIQPAVCFEIDTVASSAGFGCERIEKDACGDVGQGCGNAGLDESRTTRCSMKETIEPGTTRTRLCVKRINGLNL